MGALVIVNVIGHLDLVHPNGVEYFQNRTVMPVHMDKASLYTLFRENPLGINVFLILHNFQIKFRKLPTANPPPNKHPIQTSTGGPSTDPRRKTASNPRPSHPLRTSRAQVTKPPEGDVELMPEDSRSYMHMLLPQRTHPIIFKHTQANTLSQINTHTR